MRARFPEMALVGSLALSGFCGAGLEPRASRFAPPASRLAPRPSTVLGTTLSLAKGRAVGAIRGRVDVRSVPRTLPSRPDPGGIGMSATRDPIDRRRSVVYLETVPRAAFEANPSRPVQMHQRNERFEPHVLAIVTGTWVEFPNDDATYHNVFSLSKGQEFNLGRYAAGKMKDVRFERPGIVRVFCEIHSHMSAFILVFSHRYFAVTDDEGRYRIDGVPPGAYTVLVWNETVHGDPPRRTVTISEAGGDVDGDFTIR